MLSKTFGLYFSTCELLSLIQSGFGLDQYDIIMNKKSLMGYFQTQTLTPSQYTINAKEISDKLTHVLFAFAKVNGNSSTCEVMDEKMDIDYKFNGDLNSKNSTCPKENTLNGNYGAFFDYKRKNPHARTILSVGGASDDQKQGFKKATSSNANVKNLAKSCVEFVLNYGFDGIDYDWESPSGVDEWLAYKDLIAETRKLFNAFDLNPHYYVSLAIMPDQLTTLITEKAEESKTKYFKDINSNIDFINLMTYDASVGSDRALNDSPLYSNPNDYGQLTINTTIVNAMQYFDNSKIIVGLPLYGYQMELNKKSNKSVSSVENKDGLFQPLLSMSKENANKVLSYTQIKQNYINKDNNSFIENWDDYSKSSYLTSSDSKFFITYLSEQAIVERLNFIDKLDLGGVFFWSLGMSYSDRKEQLIEFTYKNMDQNSLNLSKTKPCAPYSNFCNIKSECEPQTEPNLKSNSCFNLRPNLYIILVLWVFMGLFLIY